MYKQIKFTLVALAIAVAPMSAQAGAPGILSGETEQQGDNDSLFMDEEQKELFEEAAVELGYTRNSDSSTG